MKLCRQCNSVKSESDFTRSSRGVGGLHHCCRDCKRQKEKARYAATYRDRRLAVTARWKESNREEVRAAHREWMRNNVPRMRAHKRDRDCRKSHATPPWADLFEIRGMYELAALFRGVGLDVHVDHIVPIKGKEVCGLHVSWNLQLLHSRANSAKKNRLPRDVQALAF